jgi:hypothetical protein
MMLINCAINNIYLYFNILHHFFGENNYKVGVHLTNKNVRCRTIFQEFFPLIMITNSPLTGCSR